MRIGISGIADLGLKIGIVGLGAVVSLSAQAPLAGEQDAYTRIELMAAPGGRTFNVVHDVSATTSGALSFSLALPSGLQAVDARATDLMTGTALTVKDRMTVVRPGEAAARHERQERRRLDQ